MALRYIRIHQRALVIGSVASWLLFCGFFFFSESALVKTVFGFPVLVFIPGFLFLLNLKIKPRFEWSFLGLSIGVSLVLLMAFGLLLNILLPLYDIIPLQGVVLLAGFSCLVIVLSVLPFMKDVVLRIPRPTIRRRECIQVFGTFFFVVWAVIGALRLNNGFSGAVTLSMLCGVSAFLVYMLVRNKSITIQAQASMLYFVSLSLLLMTSLRGTDIVGHDIQREFKVFQLTKEAGVWSVEYLHDAYNACMSITILPTIFSNLLSIPDVFVYKILFQILFAMVPVISFLCISRYFSRFIALLSTILIISFPTYFTDMAMLNRQEIAFLMFVLLVYTMFSTTLSRKVQNTLILMFGLGIVLSHYSTTYIVIFFLFAAWFGFWLFTMMMRLRVIRHFIKDRRVFGRAYVLGTKPAVPLLILVSIILLSFGWSNTFTQTSDSSIKRVIGRTIDAVLHDSESSRSTDTLYSIFSVKKLSNEEIFSLYKDNVVVPAREGAPVGTYYEDESIENYTPTFVPDELLPLTVLGTYLQRLGIPVTDLNVQLKFGTAKVVQLFLLIGIGCTLFSTRYFRAKPKVEYLFLALAGVFFLGIMVLIPVLSVEYGVLRAFQQILFIAAPFIVIGGLFLFSAFGQKIAHVCTATFVISFFLISTGVVTQTLGGYKALLHLNNSGPYYDYYYLHDSEIHALTWLQEQVVHAEDSFFQSEVQADRFLSKKIDDREDISSFNDIFPSLIQKNAFVFLGYSNVKKESAVLYQNGVLLNYLYPKYLVDIYKNKVYDSDGVIIYR